MPCPSLLSAALLSPPLHTASCAHNTVVTQASYHAALFPAHMGSAWFLSLAYLTPTPVCTQSPGAIQPHPWHLLFALVVLITPAMTQSVAWCLCSLPDCKPHEDNICCYCFFFLSVAFPLSTELVLISIDRNEPQIQEPP